MRHTSSLSRLSYLSVSLTLSAAMLPFSALAATFISADALLDVRSGKLIDSPLLKIEEGRIVELATQGKLDIPAGSELIELKGKTLLPGLMDMHVHLGSDAEDNFLESMNYSIPRQTVKAVKNAKKTLEAGFTTVRDLGDAGYSVIAVRDGINAGEIPGPRIWSAGHALSITGGHCDDNFSAPEMHSVAGGVADGPWAVRAKARENIKYGANTLKICATGGVFSKGTKVGVQQYTEDELRAAAEEAHQRGLIIAAHAHGTKDRKSVV